MKSQVSFILKTDRIQMNRLSSSFLFFLFLFHFAGEIVAQFKFTVLLMPSGVNLVTGLPVDVSQYESSHDILDAQLKELVLSEIPTKSAKHKAKKASKAAAGATTASSETSKEPEKK